MNNISKEMFLEYEKIRMSGKYNMLTDVSLVMTDMKLNPRHKSDLNIYLSIIENYSDLAKKYL